MAIRQVKTTCPFCGVGCGLVLSAAKGAIESVQADPEHPVSRGQLCVKGWQADRFLRHPDRLPRPLVGTRRGLEPVSFSTAVDAAAEALRAAIAEGSPDATGVIASARATNEDAFAAMKLARAVLGTNNVDHCARVCHSPSVAGLGRTLGSGAMTNSIADLDRADCVLVWGSDATENHPIVGGRILAARERGARLIVVDPRRTRLAHLADLHLAPQLGTDIPLACGMLHAIFSHGWQADAYLAERCTGVERVRASIAGDTPERAAETTGIAAADIVEAARIYATTPRAMLIYGLGVTQHVCGTENVIALSNLALATGHVGVDAAGINPLRGQNNVQGACDMGALPDFLPGYQRVTEAQAREALEGLWGVSLPARPGLTSLAMQHAAHDGSLRALMIFGEDPVVTDPARQSVCRALGSLDALIVAELFLTDTARLADVVFPAAAFAEKEGTFTNTERRVQRVRRALDPPGEARADWEIAAAIAERLGRPLGFASAEGVFREITRATPTYAGLSYARLDAEGGLQWPCRDSRDPGTPVLHRDRRRKLHLLPVRHTPPSETIDAQYPLQLTTFRLHHQYGSGSMTRRSPLLERENPRGALWIHPGDAERHGVHAGDRVRVRSRRGDVETRAIVSDDVPRGVVAMPYHFAETPTNALTNDALDPISRMPELKVCAVAVERA